MAKMSKLCWLLLGVMMLAALPVMSLSAEEVDPMLEMDTPPDATPAPAPEPTPAPAPEPAAPSIDTSNDTGKFQQAQSYESQGKINQALILYLQATAGNGVNGYDAQLAAAAAYRAGTLFANNKNDNAKAAKLFHFAFAVAHYQDSALRAGQAYRAQQQYALACKMFRWGAMDSNDGDTKSQCGQAFTDTLPSFQQSQGAKP